MRHVEHHRRTSFETARRMGDIEVRDYAPYVAAEVMIEGSADVADARAFPILAWTRR